MATAPVVNLINNNFPRFVNHNYLVLDGNGRVLQGGITNMGNTPPASILPPPSGATRPTVTGFTHAYLVYRCTFNDQPCQFLITRALSSLGESNHRLMEMFLKSAFRQHPELFPGVTITDNNPVFSGECKSTASYLEATGQEVLAGIEFNLKGSVSEALYKKENSPQLHSHIPADLIVLTNGYDDHVTYSATTPRTPATPATPCTSHAQFATSAGNNRDADVSAKNTDTERANSGCRLV